MKVGESLVEVLHQRGVPAREVLRGSKPAKVCERLQRGLVATCELDDPCEGLARQGARARSRWGLSGHHAIAKLVTQLPPSGLGILRYVALLVNHLATASGPRHRFDRGEHIVSFDVAACVGARMIEEHPEALEPLDLDIHTSPVGTQDIRERSTVILEHPTDVREREPEVAQRTDPVEASHVVLVIEALVTIRS